MSTGTALLRTPHVTSTAQSLRDLEAELNLMFFERRDAIEVILITLLAREHGFILGPPGTAKSELLETLCKAIIGAKYWRVLMDKQMDKSETLGQYDQPLFLSQGIWQRDITDTIQDCHVGLIDEVGNTSAANLNPLLTAMNERRGKPGKQWIDLPVLSLFGASNYLLEDSPAMWDRFLTRFTVDGIQEDGNFLALLERAAGQRPQAQITTQIPLDALLHAITVEVPSVTIPAGVFDAMRQLRTDLRAEQVVASDRRWAKCVKLVKAAAYLGGRSTADDDDLAVLRHALWELPEQTDVVQRKVLAMTSPLVKVAMELAAQVDDIVAQIDQRKGQSVETRAAYGGTAQHELGQIAERLKREAAQAQAKGRNTARLADITHQIQQARVKVFVECMNVPAERAAVMVGAL